MIIIISIIILINVVIITIMIIIMMISVVQRSAILLTVWGMDSTGGKTQNTSATMQRQGT
eukprot:12399281-Karenia_brevis.AAC.1